MPSNSSIEQNQSMRPGYGLAALVQGDRCASKSTVSSSPNSYFLNYATFELSTR